MRRKKEKHRVSATLTTREHDALRALAEREERSMDWMAAQAIKRFLSAKAAENPDLLSDQTSLDLTGGI